MQASRDARDAFFDSHVVGFCSQHCRVAEAWTGETASVSMSTMCKELAATTSMLKQSCAALTQALSLPCFNPFCRSSCVSIDFWSILPCI